ncbi:MAG: DUF1080 domain-containing protein [Verrucomicrobiota bacterium]
MKPPTLFPLLLIASVFGSHLNAEPNTLSKEEIAEGWTLLFDGKSTAGWRSYGSDTFPEKGWVIENGLLHKQSDVRGGDIMTAKTYENFEFSWEWKLEENGNNGVKYFIIPERKATIGHEYQMIDDAKVKDAYSSTAAFYLVVQPAPDKPLKAIGEWNHSRIIVSGNHVEHWLNGTKVLEYDCGAPAIMEQVQQTKFKKTPGFGEKVTGHILLTDHKDPCWFRNIKIKELP